MLQFLNFVLFTILQNAGGGGSGDASPTIANFDFKMVSKNCANFVPKWAVIFKVCAAPLLEVSPGQFWKPSPHCKFRLKNGIKNWANFVLNWAAIFKFCVTPLPEISPRTFWEPAPPPLRIFAPKWCQKIVLILC